MPLQDSSVIVDPLFSKELLESEVVPTSEEALTAKIETLYTSLEKNTALYYQGSATGSALEAFSMSEDFFHLVAQLEICFEHLCSFCDAQSLTISHAQGTFLASTLLHGFLAQLKTDFFSDRRALLYGSGKKYIEILSVFINDPHIDLNFRILQIINLLSDEGLMQSCAEGCFTRLQYAADSLKNYAVFKVPVLYRKYLQSLADEVIHRPILIKTGEEIIITRKIADYMNHDPVGFEIHSRNFILKRFKENFNLRLPEIVFDEYVNNIEFFFVTHPDHNSVLTSYFRYLLQELSKEATMTGFVNYLSEVLYKAFPVQAEYMERIKFLEETALRSLGQDPDFSLDEILIEETGLLKSTQCLEITISERLLNQGWLAFDWRERYANNHFFHQRNRLWRSTHPPFELFTENYKLFYGNLPLSWIKIDTQRQKIVNLLQQEQGLQKIQSIHFDHVALLHSLIQTPQDLTAFLNHLLPLQREIALKWIKTVPELTSYVLGYYSNEPSTDDLLEPLLSMSVKLNTQDMKELFLAAFEERFNIKRLLQERIEKLSQGEDRRMKAICRILLKKICSLRVVDFSRFTFFRSINLFQDNSYLTEINFSNMYLDSSAFFEDVYRCSFSSAKMYNMNFYSGVFNTDLALADIKNTQFNEPIEGCNFKQAELLTVGFNIVITSSFWGSNLVWVEFKNTINQCDLQKTKILNTLFLKRVLEINFYRSQLKTVVFSDKIVISIFKFAHLERVGFYGLVVNSSFVSAYLFQVEFFYEIAENRFNFSTLNEVDFKERIERCIFINAHLENVRFTEDIFGTSFDNAFCTQTSFKKKMTFINFMHANLIASEFSGEVNDCDFSFSKLNKINFFAEIANIKFNAADLNEVSFSSAMKNCEFVDSMVHLTSFISIELKNINFINTSLIKIKFIDSYLKKNDFIKTSLIQAKFENVLLEAVTFNNADLEGVVFKSVQFNMRVDFLESNLKNTDFSDSDLSQVNFFDSNLENLQLKNSIITPQQLFDIFYSAGLRDFSEVYLSETDIKKNDFLSLYQNKFLNEAILSESIFKGLAKLGFRNFSKTDLSKIKISEFIHFYHNIEYSFSEAILPEVFLLPRSDIVQDKNTKEQSLSLSECLSKHQRDKREKNRCVITWSDVDPFNKNTEDIRDFEKIIIDSDVFIETLFSTSDIKKRGKLLELIDTTDIAGSGVKPLVKLRIAQKAEQYFYRMSHLSGVLSQGLTYENILMDFLHEDYSDVVINVGVLAVSGLSHSFAEEILVQSEKLKNSGKFFLSQYLKLSAPFLRRGLSTSYIVYDLVRQVSALAKGNKDALVNIIGDGIFISTDVLETGIEVLELSGASLEMAEFVTPVGQILGALVLVSTQSYHAARAVAKIKALIPLTPWQTLVEGLDAFLGINFSENIQDLMELNQAYIVYSENIRNFLEKNPVIKYYVVPSIDFMVEHMHKICRKTFAFTFNVQCRSDVVKHINLIPDSVLYLKQEPQSGMLFSQLNPLKNSFNEEELFCNPYKVVEIGNETLFCDSALVIVNPWANENQTQTLLALDDDNDIAHGFAESVNTFIINNGQKIYIGGEHADRFVVNASTIKGWFDGGLGSDLLDLRFYRTENKELVIDLPNEILKQDTIEILRIRNFERFLGREKQKELLLVTRHTEFVDLQGGAELYFDEIKIDANVHNAQLEIMLRDRTIVTNLARSGDFRYIVPSVEEFSVYDANLTKYSNLIFPKQIYPVNHTFLFDYHLSDLSSVTINRSVDDYHVLFNFFFDNGGKFSNHSVKLTYFPIQAHYFFKSDTQLKIGEKDNLYAFLASELAVQELIETYAPVARRLGLTLFFHQVASNEAIIIGHTKHQVLKNDLFASKTHLVANGGENIYRIIVNGDRTFSVPDVIIYQQTTDERQHVLDLRQLNSKIAYGILDNPRMHVSVIKFQEDLRLSLLFAYPQEDNKDLLELSTIINIILKQGISWYRQLTILFNRVPLQFFEAQPERWQLKPLPLSFDASHKNIILTKDDIEVGNQIILHRLADHHLFLRDGFNLWLTTLFASTSYLNKNYTILFKDFYLYSKMQSLNLIFQNTELLLSDHVNDIISAENLEDKLTGLEMIAWEEVSKQRGAGSKEQQAVPAIQTRLLADTLSHNTSHFTSHVCSSVPSLHHSWFYWLKKSIEKTLEKVVWSTVSYWHDAFHRKTVSSVACYADARTDCWVEPIDMTVFYTPKLQSQQTMGIIGHGQPNTDFRLLANNYPSFNAGILQLLDLGIRKYTVRDDVATQCKIKKRTQKIHNSTFFFKQRCEAANDRLQTASAKYQK